MRIAGVFQGFAYARGRATTMVELMKPLHEAGHQVDVFVTDPNDIARAPVEGMQPVSFTRFNPSTPYDVIVYNSWLGPRVLGPISRSSARKLMCQHSFVATDPGLKLADKVWFPSREAMKVDHGQYPKFVVPPPINPDLYRVPLKGTKIMASLSAPHKGGPLVAQLARELPQFPFLVVKDPRGKGVSHFRRLRNVQLVDIIPPRDLFAAARIQLFPSRSETYGRVAVEGAVSGIPLIAHPHPGIKEAMNGHGIWVGRNQPAAWKRQIVRLMTDKTAWQAASRDVAKRGAAINYQQDRARFLHEVETMV